MKHGLKQQIKRGLSVLMAASMVASSALPVMAEEVVEEAVEVEVVSEEVADVEDDVVVDVADEEVLEYEEVVVEDSANIVTDGPAGDYDQESEKHTTHIANYKKGDLTLTITNGKVVGATVKVPCDLGDTADPIQMAGVPSVPGIGDIKYGYNSEGKTIYALVISAKKEFQKADCKLEQDAKATYQLYLVPEDENGNPNQDVLLECVRSESDVIATEEYTKAWTHTMPNNPNLVTVQPTCMTLGEATYICEYCKKPVKDEPVKMLNHEWYTDGTIYWADDASDAWMIFTCQNGPEDEAHKTGTGHKPHTMKLSLKDFIREYEYTGTGAIDTMKINPPTCTGTGYVYYVVDATPADIEKLLGFRKASATLEEDDEFAAGVDMASYLAINGTNTNKKKITLKAIGHNIKDVAFNFGEDAGNVTCEVTFVCENAGCTLNRVKLTVTEAGTVTPNDKGVTGKVEEIVAKRQQADCTGVNEGRYYHAIVKLGNTTYDSSDYVADRFKEIKNTDPRLHHTFNVEGANTLENAIADLVTKQPTCIEKGTGVFKCKKCGVLSNSDEIFENGSYKDQVKVVNKVTEILPLGHDIVPSTTYLSKSTCSAEAVLNAQCQRCKKHVDNRPEPLGIKYAKVTQTTISAANDGLFAEDYAKITVKDSKAHKFEIDANSVVWAKDLKSVSVQVKCVCGAADGQHTKGQLTTASGQKLNLDNAGNGTCTFTLTAAPVIEKEATGFETGKMHYEAAVKFTDDLGKAQDLGTLKSKSVEIPATGEKTVTTITINPKTVTYTGDRQKADVVTNGPKATVRYYKDAAMTQQYSGEPYTTGTYYVKATVAEGEKYTAAEATGTLVIKKADPKVTVTPATKTVKNTKKNTVSIKVTQKNKGGQTGKVSYTARSKKIKVNKNGVVTIAKGTKKGTYKVDVTVKATTNYNAYTKTIKITVK